MQYRGYTIRPVTHQGCRNYVVPQLGSDIAVNVKTAKRWIDAVITENDTKPVRVVQSMQPFESTNVKRADTESVSCEV